ncbi:flagellar biosynthesis protein FlhF [Alkalicoccobacillus porphyridii]|uniref:Flagellar biosynthesis protein FlhF n=1 Tax=Alkalicoccobacillus porphyridii TaxID=2597270 RepID=A0A553ZYH2_9BACI|nr:flagellar biosynthesis protein FlhF [Alkalicoccobacillus porphyridii]TSB46426.1 flagellar biosynthesis protein FlhF [Alkalicoccobacillus porphyridii]
MKLRKFQASSMPEALNQIRMELGSEAVILHTKEIATGGWFGFFSKKQLEVTAAVDPAAKSAYTKSPPKSPALKAVEPLQNTAQQDVSEKRKADHVPISADDAPDAVRQLDREFEKQEVSVQLRTELREQLFGYWYSLPKEKRSTLALYQEARRWLSSQIREVKIGDSMFEKKYMIFAGPTGVGKTTTIAKLAAEAALHQKKRVAIFTTDTYRIAAIDQLKTYASILQMPIEVIYSLEDFHKASETYSDYDLILIDTAGRNFIHDFYLQELQKTIDLSDQAALYVVLSLTSKYSDMKSVLQQFKKLPVNQVIFTKKDETSTYGAMLNVMIDDGLGIAYLTNGQNVPDDVIHVNEDLVLSTVMEGITHDGSG